MGAGSVLPRGSAADAASPTTVGRLRVAWRSFTEQYFDWTRIFKDAVISHHGDHREAGKHSPIRTHPRWTGTDEGGRYQLGKAKSQRPEGKSGHPMAQKTGLMSVIAIFRQRYRMPVQNSASVAAR
jgi:hypothetical protein